MGIKRKVSPVSFLETKIQLSVGEIIKFKFCQNQHIDCIGIVTKIEKDVVVIKNSSFDEVEFKVISCEKRCKNCKKVKNWVMTDFYFEKYE